MLLASAEYMFPITADDMLRGVVFCDTGTVEPTIEQLEPDATAWRPASACGSRSRPWARRRSRWTSPSRSSSESGDDEQIFSFFVGFNR